MRKAAIDQFQTTGGSMIDNMSYSSMYTMLFAAAILGVIIVAFSKIPDKEVALFH